MWKRFSNVQVYFQFYHFFSVPFSWGRNCNENEKRKIKVLYYFAIEKVILLND